MSHAEHDPAPSVLRAVTILDLLAHSRRGRSLSGVSRSLSLPKSSTYRILTALMESGHVVRDTRNKSLRLGFRIVSLGRAALCDSLLRDVARPFVVSLMRNTGLTVHLGVLDSGQAVIVDKEEPLGPGRVGTWVGRTLDVHSTALGKALVSFLPNHELELEFKVRGFIKHNQKTIVTRDRLEEAMRQVRELGYSVDDEEDELGVRCVGVPITDGRGSVIAALSAAGTTAQIPTYQFPFLGQTLKIYSASISASLAAHTA
ncbi:MAG: IclR family transcriptional regulator [Terriglobia bacterium]